MSPVLHAELAPIRFLVGTWAGAGTASYPTTGVSHYREGFTLDHVGDEFLRWELESWSTEDAAPVHFERGFLRPGEEGMFELTLAHPLGLTEIAYGRPSASSIEFETLGGGISRTKTGSAVLGLIRRYQVDGDVLRYEVEMQMDAVPMDRHLTAELRRIAS